MDDDPTATLQKGEFEDLANQAHPPTDAYDLGDRILEADDDMEAEGPPPQPTALPHRLKSKQPRPPPAVTTDCDPEVAEPEPKNM